MTKNYEKNTGLSGEKRARMWKSRGLKLLNLRKTGKEEDWE